MDYSGVKPMFSKKRKRKNDGGTQGPFAQVNIHVTSEGVGIINCGRRHSREYCMNATVHMDGIRGDEAKHGSGHL
jgi:hypothetical protein